MILGLDRRNVSCILFIPKEVIPMGIPSKEFKFRRLAMGLTQEALARRLDITLRAVALIEAKDEVPERYVLALTAIEAERASGEHA